jgi:hypothetical protein
VLCEILNQNSIKAIVNTTARPVKVICRNPGTIIHWLEVTVFHFELAHFAATEDVMDRRGRFSALAGWSAPAALVATKLLDGGWE